MQRFLDRLATIVFWSFLIGFVGFLLLVLIANLVTRPLETATAIFVMGLICGLFLLVLWSFVRWCHISADRAIWKKQVRNGFAREEN